jgi:hypothetical protein
MQQMELLQPVLFGTVHSKLWFHIITITDMSKAQQNQKKTAQLKSETIAIASRRKINTVNRKKTPPVKTHRDVFNSAIGDSLRNQHKNPPALSIQHSPIHSERTLVHRQPQHP